MVSTRITHLENQLTFPRPFWVDTHVTPPLKATGSYNAVQDRHKESWSFYSDIPSLLYQLRSKGIKIAAASRTHAPDLAREVLSLLHLDPAHTGGKKTRAIEYFDEFEVYPGSKMTHFKSLHRKTGLPYEDMLFFDDESRNMEVDRELGVLMVLVPKGVSLSVFDRGVLAWRKRRGLQNAGAVNDEIDGEED